MATGVTADCPLAGRVAMVTGGSSGIGRAIALALGGAGATVVAVGRNVERLDDLLAEAGAAGSDLATIACELTDDESVRALVSQVESRYPALHVVVHAAGAIDFGTVEDAGMDGFDRLVRLNLRAPYLLTQAVMPLLRRTQGHILFVNSSAGIRPSPGVAAYGATKHALRGFADALRDEVGPLGVRVTSIYPGRTRTPLQASILRWENRGEPPNGLLEPSDIASVVVSLVALPPAAEVTDIHIRPAASVGNGG